MALEIYNLTRNNNISLNIQWFPRELNKTADLLRKSIDYDDWLVTIMVYMRMGKRLVQLTLQQVGLT